MSGLNDMNSIDRVTLFVLCALLFAAAVMAYRGMNRNNDSLAFGGWLIAIAAAGIAAAWFIIGQNPLARF